MLNEGGYGRYRLPGQPVRTSAHRAAWRFANGEVPPGLMVMHLCDNPPCVNPTHLCPGTAADNMTDKKLKGRGRGSWPGEKNQMAKLTNVAVAEIRDLLASGARGVDIAPRFGVKPSTVWAIKRGVRWQKVP